MPRCSTYHLAVGEVLLRHYLLPHTLNFVRVKNVVDIVNDL